MKGARLRKIDEEYAIHLLAWKSFQAQGVKNNRKPVYDNFSKFYDYETRINEVLGTKKQKNDDSQDPVSRYKDFLLKKESVKNGN